MIIMNMNLADWEKLIEQMRAQALMLNQTADQMELCIQPLKNLQHAQQAWFTMWGLTPPK
jgi:prefoldin subunit 5